MSTAKVIEAAIVCVCALIFALMAMASLAVYVPLITGNGLASHDALSFWSTGQLLAHGKNPYDAAEILRIQRAAGSSNDPLIMRNPPIALPLVLPLGYLS